MTHKLSICLPNFPGFYPSWLDQELDHLADREVEWMVEKQSDQTYHPEHYQPEELRLDEGEFHEILFERGRPISAMHFAVAKTYAGRLQPLVRRVVRKNSLGPDGRIELGAEYEEDDLAPVLTISGEDGQKIDCSSSLNQRRSCVYSK